MKTAHAFDPRLLVLLAWCAIGLDPATATTQSLGLLLLDRDATTTRLSVTNANVPNVNLQGSFNLEDWFLVQSATPILGTASFTLTNTEPIDAWFFRAVAAPAPPVINVGPQPDTNQFASALILPETGGRLEITDANGVFYQLTVRSNLVTEPTAIRMTVITNFTDMPLTNRYRAAVAFEPEGIEFRGAAELKIRFPGPIPMLEMVGYGFDGSGGDFHLLPWESDTNEVTLSVSHFSGTGVAAEPFQAKSNQDYSRGLTYTRDAIREADNWAGDQYREIYRLRHDEKMTQEQAIKALRLIKLNRNNRVYINAIKPLLAAAARDCAVGEVVLKRLDELEGESGVYGEGGFYQAALEVAPTIRCNCARYYLELCERNASASGTGLTDALDGILYRVELMTGMVDDPNCDLGSDNQIWARMAKAKCHKPWEGTVRFTRVYTSGYTNVFSGADSSSADFLTERDDVAYFGRINEFVNEEGDVLDDGSTWQTWTFKLAGKFTASHLDSQDNIYVTKDWTLTGTEVTQGVADLAAEGELMIRFENELFTDVGAEAGLGTNHIRMPLRLTTETKVECRTAQYCPKPIPSETTNAGTEDLYFGESPGIRTPGLVATWQKNGSLKIVFTRNNREPYLAPSTGYNETTETLTVQLFRGSAP